MTKLYSIAMDNLWFCIAVNHPEWQSPYAVWGETVLAALDFMPPPPEEKHNYLPGEKVPCINLSLPDGGSFGCLRINRSTPENGTPQPAPLATTASG